MQFLGEFGLLGSQPFRAEHRSPRGRGVTAADKFLIDLFVAGSAISRRQMRGNHKTVVIEFVLFLTPLRLVAVQAVHARCGVLAHLEFVNDRVLLPRMAFRAFPGGPDEGCIRLVDDWAGGTLFRDVRRISIPAPAWAAFRAVCLVGGDHGWYSSAWLWSIRGWMDRLVGGPGLRRGRRHTETVAYGEALDFWRVVGIENNRSLVLRAEMKVPGEAVLEFRIEPTVDGQCSLQQSALFQPRGLFGILYWYSVAPFHHIVFGGMLREFARKPFKSPPILKWRRENWRHPSRCSPAS